MIKKQMSRNEYKEFLIERGAYEGQSLEKIPKKAKGIEKQIGLNGWLK